jgi:hypothetical protein
MARFVALAVLLALSAVGCQKERDRPASANLECDGSKCIGPGPGGGGGGKDGGAEGGIDSATDAPSVTVSGSVVLLTGDDFYTGAPFGETATVAFEGADGLPVQGNYDGSTFSVPGAAIGSSVWATVAPTSKAALPTIQPADTTASPLELAVVPGTTIDTIYTFLSTPVVRELGAAHVVIRFLNAKTGVPVTGVTVTHQNLSVAYDTGGSWSDTAPGTGVAGYAVVVNVPTAGSPSQKSFKFTAATAAGGVYLLTAPDSVTLADVLVD